MNILVTAGSKYGSTEEIGQIIAETINASKHTAELMSPDDINSLDGFDACIIGSAIYAGRWRREIRDLIDTNADRLQQLPVWLFSSGPVGNPLRPEQQDIVHVETIMERIQPVEHKMFGGKIDKAKLSRVDKAIIATLNAPVGDYRSKKDIKDWAQSIIKKLDTMQLA